MISTSFTKQWLPNFILLTASLLGILIISEIVFQALLFSNASRMDTFRDPGLYANPFCDDDHWKLRYLCNNETQETPDKLLGWIKSSISQYSYLHKQFPLVKTRTPVLLYGDSFAKCLPSEQCFDAILNSDGEFTKEFYLLNYGIGGYGLDQIYLLFKKSIANYQNPIVIVSLMTLDMDRSILSVRKGPKPHFEVNGGVLELIEMPITTSHETYFSVHPPEIVSYLYRLISRRINSLSFNNIHDVTRCNTERHQRQCQVNQHLISEFIPDLKGLGIRYVFLSFHPQNEVSSNNDDWRDQLLHQTLTGENVPYISSKTVIREHARVHHKDSYSEYYVRNDGHPTSYQNHLISHAIKAHLLRNRTSNFSQGTPLNPRVRK